MIKAGISTARQVSLLAHICTHVPFSQYARRRMLTNDLHEAEEMQPHPTSTDSAITIIAPQSLVPSQVGDQPTCVRRFRFPPLAALSWLRHSTSSSLKTETRTACPVNRTLRLSTPIFPFQTQKICLSSRLLTEHVIMETRLPPHHTARYSDRYVRPHHHPSSKPQD